VVTAYTCSCRIPSLLRCGVHLTGGVCCGLDIGNSRIEGECIYHAFRTMSGRVQHQGSQFLQTLQPVRASSTHQHTSSAAPWTGGTYQALGPASGSSNPTSSILDRSQAHDPAGGTFGYDPLAYMRHQDWSMSISPPDFQFPSLSMSEGFYAPDGTSSMVGATSSRRPSANAFPLHREDGGFQGMTELQHECNTLGEGSSTNTGTAADSSLPWHVPGYKCERCGEVHDADVAKCPN